MLLFDVFLIAHGLECSLKILKIYMLRGLGVLCIVGMILTILNETGLGLWRASIIVIHYYNLVTKFFLAAQQSLFVNKVLNMKCWHLVLRFLVLDRCHF